MSFGDFIDSLIEPFAPSRVRQRVAERLALKEIRQYDAAQAGRRTQGWRRPSTSADREIRGGLVKLRDGVRELVRNNKYAASAMRQMTANVVGDGITARAQHDDQAVAKAAQDAWDRWAESRVDGRDDFYGVQKLAFRATAEGGEALIVWGPDGDGPDGRCAVIEGDLLDHLKDTQSSADASAARIIQGVEFDRIGDRAAYWLLDHHPGDLGGFSRASKRYDAQHVDHIFEALRPGQTRGVSWFAPLAMTLRDLGDFEEAVLMKKKVEACLALILTPPDNANPTSPFDQQAQAAAAGGEKGRSPDTLRPGMVFRARPGETASTLNPTASGGDVEFLRQQVMSVSANLAPYHLISGDPSQANYTQTRALLLGFWANLDDWQQNMMVPHGCNPAFARRMRRKALETGDRRFLQVKPHWAMPVRRLLDPLKDMAGLTAELRLGVETLPDVLAARGKDWREHFKTLAEVNTEIDRLGLALEADPRRVTQSGVLQAAAGYLRPQGDS